MKSSNSKPQPKQLKLAEAGILFVLALAVTIFIGVKVASRGSDLVADQVAATSIEHTSPRVDSGAEPAAFETAVFVDPAATVTVDPAATDPGSASAAAATADHAAPTTPTLVSYAQAEAAYFEKRYADAVDLFTAYCDDHPENAWGSYMLGLSYWKDGCPEAAEESFRQALAIKPDFTKGLVNLGRVLLDQNRPGDALTYLEQAIAQQPDHVDALRVLGRIYHNLDRRDEAIDAYEGALRLDDQDAWSLNNLGLLYIESERFDDALAPLARATQLNAGVACFQNNLGVALERTGHAEQAVSAFETALANDPDYAKAQESLERVSSLPVPTDAAQVDLAPLADGFRIEPAAPTDTAAPSDPVADPVIADLDAENLREQ